MNINIIKPGMKVDVTPLADDMFHDFTGTVATINFHTGLICVIDQDDIPWDCFPAQLALNTPIPTPKRYGCYSLTQANLYGTVTWTRPDGSLIEVTEVSSDPNFSSNKWPDKVLLGEVDKFVSNNLKQHTDDFAIFDCKPLDTNTKIKIKI